MQISSTINHTGRRKLKRSEVQISVNSNGETAPSFDARFSLDTNNLPNDAAIHVEAYHRNTLQRFDFGTVNDIRPPSDTTLGELDLSGPTLFRVRIVDQSGSAGRLIASVDRLRAEGDDEEERKSSLIVVKATPMGEQVWKMSFEDGCKPTLCINSRIPDALNQIKNNHHFQSLVLPAALRETLVFYFWNNEIDDDSLQEQWILFAESLGGAKPHSEDASELLTWVDEVVEEFSTRFHLCKNLVLCMEGDG